MNTSLTTLKFWREITIDHVTPEMLTMEKQGDFTLIWKENTIEIWYETLKEATL